MLTYRNHPFNLRYSGVFTGSLWCLAISLALMGVGFAQGTGNGEVAYNAMLYKGSHNSYARDESLAQQIDNYNVWQIELDIFDYGDIVVNHLCVAPFTGASTLRQLLTKMTGESSTFSQKFTMIYLDMKGGDSGDGCLIGWGATLPQRLQDAFVSILGAAHIYPASEFVGADRSAWPSYQELLRRGYHWGIIVDWHGANPSTSDAFFFFATSANPPMPTVSANTILVNLDGGCDNSPTTEDPVLRDRRWLYRGYPSGRCAADCQEINDDYWNNLVHRKFNYIATNCVNWDHTFSPLTQSPAPLFVDRAAIVSCPRGYGRCEWGTVAFPYHDLLPAIGRASPASVALISSGDYQVSSMGQQLTISKAITLLSQGNGPVTIR